MSKCKDCGAPMKPLFSGEYCSASCDRPEAKPDPAKDPDKTPAYTLPPHPMWGGFLQVQAVPSCPQCGNKACLQILHHSGVEEFQCSSGHAWVAKPPTQLSISLKAWVPTDGLLNWSKNKP